MAPLMTWEWSSLNGGCFRAAKALGKYNQALRKKGITPYDLEFTKHAFQKLLHEASELGWLSVDQCPESSRKSRSCCCSQDSSANICGELNFAAQRIRQQKVWFGCLDCLSGEEGVICRLDHGTGPQMVSEATNV